MARMTAFSPGQSPPPVRIPIRIGVLLRSGASPSWRGPPPIDVAGSLALDGPPSRTDRRGDARGARRGRASRRLRLLLGRAAAADPAAAPRAAPVPAVTHQSSGPVVHPAGPSPSPAERPGHRETVRVVQTGPGASGPAVAAGAGHHRERGPDDLRVFAPPSRAGAHPRRAPRRGYRVGQAGARRPDRKLPR